MAKKHFDSDVPKYMDTYGLKITPKKPASTLNKDLIIMSRLMYGLDLGSYYKGEALHRIALAVRRAVNQHRLVPVATGLLRASGVITINKLPSMLTVMKAAWEHVDPEVAAIRKAYYQTESTTVMIRLEKELSKYHHGDLKMRSKTKNYDDEFTTADSFYGVKRVFLSYNTPYAFWLHETFKWKPRSYYIDRRGRYIRKDPVGGPKWLEKAYNLVRHEFPDILVKLGTEVFGNV